MVHTDPRQHPDPPKSPAQSILTQRPVLPVPYPNRLVVTRGDNPGELVVEEDGPDVVEMAVQGEQTAAGLVRPDLDLVVVTARYKQGLPPSQQAVPPSGSILPSSPVSCGSQHRGRGHRALRSGQSGCPCGSPTAEWWRSGGRRGSMVWGSVSVSRGKRRGARGVANRLGWNAMPLARDDLDSNWRR